MFLESMAVFDSMIADPNFKEVFLGSAMGGLFGVLIGFTLALLVLSLFVMYLYVAFTWMTIGKKLGYKNSWLSFIPIANLFLLPILAKKHWCWGWFLLLPPVYFVFAIIWTWKIYKLRNYPGWWSLFLILWIMPFLKGIGVIVNLVLFGFIAFKDRKSRKAVQKKKR